ncbi:MAG: hypothetical protein U0599_12940 [Vicinamibacteria bacterium]
MPQPRPFAVPTQMSFPSMSAEIMKVCGTPTGMSTFSTTLPPTVTFARPRPVAASRV